MRQGTLRKFVQIQILKISHITDKKIIWTTMKPFVSDKCTIASKISLEHGNNIFSDDQESTETFQ